MSEIIGAVACRGNPLGHAGWQSIMDVLAQSTRLKSLNGCSEFQLILAGGLITFDGDNKEIALAVGPFLARSASTLVSIELR